MQLLGGHPDVFLMSAFVIALYALLHPGRGLLYHRRPAALMFPIGVVTAVFALGVALAAAQVLPTVTLAVSSWTRPQENVTSQAAASLTQAEYWLLLLPDLLGRAGDDTYFGPSGFWERCGYGGVLTLTLALVGLEERMHHFPAQLSGGEQQRVAIARALAKNPEMLLCDEPTGAVDFETGKHVLRLLVDLQHELGKTILVITHNGAIAPVADRVIRLRSGAINEIHDNPEPQPPEEVSW